LIAEVGAGQFARPDHGGFPDMDSMIHFLIPVALAAVAVILLLGFVNMMRGGSANRSQTLMRMRILFQFIAIAIVMAALYFAGRR
jgi:hypothetical protein